MALIADAGALFALYDRSEAHHAAVRRAIEQEAGRVIVPVIILAELDYLVRTSLGVAAELDLLEAVVGGAYTLEMPTREDLVRSSELVIQYRDLDIGLADASVVATSERLGIERILTVDYRDFRVVRPKSGRPFVLLPADETPRPRKR